MSALARTVQKRRVRKGLSQSDLAEAAGLSTKTIQRLEAGNAVRIGSRREVLRVLEIEPEEIDIDRPPSVEQPWRPVDDGGPLFDSLTCTSGVEIEIDRDAWRNSRRQRPWYRQELVFARRDPVDVLLDLVDRAKECGSERPGQKAKDREATASTLKAAQALGWRVASRVDGRGQLHLYFGSEATVAKRTEEILQRSLA